MFYAECVLCAAVVDVETFGMDVQMALQVIDVFLDQLHVAKTHQPPWARTLAIPRAVQQTSMDRHRLGTVLGQMHRVQSVFAA